MIRVQCERKFVTGQIVNNEYSLVLRDAHKGRYSRLVRFIFLNGTVFERGKLVPDLNHLTVMRQQRSRVTGLFAYAKAFLASIVLRGLPGRLPFAVVLRPAHRLADQLIRLCAIHADFLAIINKRVAGKCQQQACRHLRMR
ncbi:hypothetical protein D3C74_343260 [compost metagenome]